MGFFSYSVKTQDGKIEKGTLQIDSKEKALEYLHSQGNVVLSLKETKGKILAKKRGKVKTDELVVFTRQLTTLIESGIPIVGSLDILNQQIANPYFKEVVSSISNDLKEGASFASSLAKHSKVFPEIYASMVEAAETSGNLPQILDRLSIYLEKMSALRKKIISSLIYPTIVVIMTISMTAFLLLKIVPTFKELYDSLGAPLPLPTLILMGFADFVKRFFFYILIAFVGIVSALKKYISTPSGMRRYHKFLLRLPILGDVIKKVSIAKFARTFATLVRSSVAITTSLDIVGKTSGNKIIEEAVSKAQKAIQEGISISEPLRESDIFPPMVVEMIAVGERTGRLDQMLTKIAQFYEEQTDAVISGLTSIIEPVLLVFLGVVVGFIVIALFLPIINISQIMLRG
jgi:type IV pilus assembly protein PilC